MSKQRKVKDSKLEWTMVKGIYIYIYIYKAGVRKAETKK